MTKQQQLIFNFIEQFTRKNYARKIKDYQI